MDDLKYGKRNKRGDWAPNEPVRYAPLFMLPPRAQGVPEVAAALLPALERALRPLGRGLLGVGDPAGRDDADAELGLGALALRGERGRDVPLLRRLRAAALRAEAAGAALQVQRQVPVRAAEQRVLVREPELDNILRTFLSGVPIWTAIEVLVLWAFANGYVPWLSFADHPLYLAALALVRADHPRGPLLLHPPADPHAVRSTSGCIRSTTTRSTRRPGRRCRCTRSSTCSTSRPSSTT